MATWLIIVLGIVAAIVVGLIVAVLYRKADNASDDLQRRINKLENAFSEAGASWMAELLEDMVVGDLSEIGHKLRAFAEAKDTEAFFLENIARPCGLYARRVDAAKVAAAKK